MIKISTGKGKLLSFDIDIEGGNSNEIKEGRFIISCPNKNYKLMFNAIIENNNIMVDLPPLNINESSGKCSLEMISNDNQYYSIWEDSIKFDRELTIKVKEQKDIYDKKPTVKLNENKTKSNKITKSSETVTLYRTIKCDMNTVNKIISENKFSMKPKKNLNVKFYKNDSQLINDLENIDYGLCIGMSVCTNGIIKENRDTLIVNSSYLDTINENNVMFLIKEGRIIQLTKDNLNG